MDIKQWYLLNIIIEYKYKYIYEIEEGDNDFVEFSSGLNFKSKQYNKFYDLIQKELCNGDFFKKAFLIKEKKTS